MVVVGDNGNNVINTGGGNDTIEGLGGNDIIDSGNGADTVFGGDGDDIINAGGGNDDVLGGNGNDVIFGGANRDRLLGNDGGDRLYGEGSNDQVQGGKGNDYVNGGGGNDKLFGNDGADYLYGGDGDDLLLPTNRSNKDGFVDYFGFDKNDGNDQVANFDITLDRIHLIEGGSVSFVYNAAKNNTVMTYGDTKVTFVNVNLSDPAVQASIFVTDAEVQQFGIDNYGDADFYL